MASTTECDVRLVEACLELRRGFGTSRSSAAVSREERGVTHVLVLNASYEPLNVCTVRRALVLVFKGKAEVIEEEPRVIRAASRRFPWPHVIRLVSYVRVPRVTHRRISRKALFARDGFCCQYCGVSGKLTLDHVVPRSRGGPSAWENIVASCAPCNLRKGSRLPDEAEMHPRRRPRPPAAALFITLSAPAVSERWEPYLAFGRRPVEAESATPA